MIPTVSLNTGQSIPQVGLGLWRVTDEAAFNTMFDAAVAAGYTHYDTAQIYHNEQLLGAAVQRQQLNREQLFVTTKIDVRQFGAKRTPASFEQSLQKLRMEYVDLLLLHFPVPVVRTHAWRALEDIRAKGQAKSIGVSNFTIRHLEQLRRHVSIVPAVNQVELHVFLQQPELLAYCREHDIVVEAYSPLAHARETDNAIIQSIAAKHDKSYAQIMLRWCVQQGLVILPKSKTPSRLQENMNVFDFTLDADDLEQIKTQNKNLRTCWSPVHIP